MAKQIQYSDDVRAKIFAGISLTLGTLKIVIGIIRGAFLKILFGDFDRFFRVKKYVFFL